MFELHTAEAARAADPASAVRAGQPRGGILVRAREAEVLDGDPTSVITLLAETATTGGVVTANRSLLRKGSTGAPPHYHERSDELFYVLGGTLRVLLGDEVLTLRTGDFLLVPPFMPHAFAPAVDVDADVFFAFLPGSPRFDYFRMLDDIHRGHATLDDLKGTEGWFDNHYVESPLWAETLAD